MPDPRDRYTGIELLLIAPAAIFCFWPGVPATLICITPADDFSLNPCGAIIAMVLLGGLGLAALLRLILFGLKKDGRFVPWVIVGLLCGTVMAAPLAFFAIRSSPHDLAVGSILFGLPLLVAARRLYLEYSLAKRSRPSKRESAPIAGQQGVAADKEQRGSD